MKINLLPTRGVVKMRPVLLLQHNVCRIICMHDRKSGCTLIVCSDIINFRPQRQGMYQANDALVLGGTGKQVKLPQKLTTRSTINNGPSNPPTRQISFSDQNLPIPAASNADTAVIEDSNHNAFTAASSKSNRAVVFGSNDVSVTSDQPLSSNEPHTERFAAPIQSSRRGASCRSSCVTSQLTPLYGTSMEAGVGGEAAYSAIQPKEVACRTVASRDEMQYTNQGFCTSFNAQYGPDHATPLADPLPRACTNFQPMEESSNSCNLSSPLSKISLNSPSGAGTASLTHSSEIPLATQPLPPSSLLEEHEIQGSPPSFGYQARKGLSEDNSKLALSILSEIVCLFFDLDCCMRQNSLQVADSEYAKLCEWRSVLGPLGDTKVVITLPNECKSM